MKIYQKILLLMFLFLGQITQMQAQCTMTAHINPDTSSCPIQHLYAWNNGGTGPFAFLWSNGETSFYNSNLVAGFYSVTITDAMGCTATDSYSIVSSSPMFATYNVADATCGNSNGAIFTAVTGGSGSYSYNWYDNSWNFYGTASNLLNVPAGIYHLYITDNVHGCVTQLNNMVVQNFGGAISATIYPDSLNCPSMYLVAAGSGGTSPYTYTWSDGNTSNIVTAAIPGNTYSVTITDANGCTGVTSHYVDSACCNGATTITPTHASCGTNNGSATASISGFTSPSFAWSNGSTTPTINNLPAGVYSVTVTDANGCSATASTQIYDTGFLWVFLWGNGCPADSLQAYVSGGSAMPYTFDWSTGSSVTQSNPMDFEAVTGLGVYSVTVTDANGCSSTASFEVHSALTATATTQDASCAGNDGAINLTVTGGDGFYFYSWSNGAGTEDLTGLQPGIYNVQVYDSSNCIVFVDSILVGGGGNAFVNSYTIPSNCADSAGEIVQIVSGLTNPNFIWNTGATTSSLSGLSSGWYGCTITDNSGCTLYRNYYVDKDSSCYLTISGYVYNVSLSNTCTPTGATPIPYTMVRLQPSGLVTFTNAYGMYSFTVLTVGNYTVEFVNAGTFYNQLCPVGTLAVNGNVFGYYPNNNFYVTSPNAQDLTINIGHYTTATPGFPLWTVMQFCNAGQVTMSGTIDFVYDTQIVFDQIWTMSNIGSPVFTGHNATNNLLTFSFSNLQPGQCGTIYPDFTVPATVALGNTVANTATIYPLNGDATPANNTDIDTLIVIGSWDPNEKLVGALRSGDDHGGAIFVGDNTLEYTIHFQNLGTAPAYRVVIRDELEANLLIETIREVQMSHNGILSIENGNELVVQFNDINLPHASFDYHGSNGFVKFTIDRTAGLPVNTTIHNDAGIYFDFNAPVITNDAPVTIIEVLSVAQAGSTELNTSVFPNPFQDQLTVQYDLATDSEVSIQLYDALGARIRTIQAQTTENAGTQVHQMQIADLVPGIYFLSVETNVGRSLHKVIKK